MQYVVAMDRILVYWCQDSQRWVAIGPKVTGGYAGRSVWEAVGCFMACTSSTFRANVSTVEPTGGPQAEGPFSNHINGSEVPRWARDALDGIV